MIYYSKSYFEDIDEEGKVLVENQKSLAHNGICFDSIGNLLDKAEEDMVLVEKLQNLVHNDMYFDSI
jgi:hypothetical protein